mmetsp:Transcript_68197/g.158262  ORF Transcript_68197/g.158262 Transcript_68197/m.158262 type:complete len:238 (-) Transcript_68197:282-995(-)
MRALLMSRATRDVPSRRVGLPPGLAFPGAPCLGCIPLPPGLHLEEPAPGLKPTSMATNCSRRGGSGQQWASDECSTTDSERATPLLTPRESDLLAAPLAPWDTELLLPAAAGRRWLETPSNPGGCPAFPVSGRVKGELDSAYSPGRVLLEAAKVKAETATLEQSSAVGTPTSEVPPVPSVGSLGHHLGICRPCDFTYRSGSCREGAACKFCHLCGPEVSRQRRKERRQQLNLQKAHG